MENVVTTFWRDRPVFVTGASGLLGSWLVGRLLALGALPVCLVRDWTPASPLLADPKLRHATIVRGEVCDQATIERALGEYEISVVFHLAAQTIVGIANQNPVSTFDSNVRGTWTILEACRRSPLVRQIVVASSDKAYGDQPTLPYDEDMPLAGRNPYDASKSCADLIAQSYAASFGLPVAITRCGNLYGGGDLNWNRLIPGTIRALLRGERPVVRSDGKHLRDYLYVEDGASACIMLAESLASRPSLAGRAFNFSTETPTTVLDIVRALSAQIRSDLPPDIRNEARGEIRDQYLSAARARSELGWAPTFDLAEGLGRTIAWYKALLGQ